MLHPHLNLPRNVGIVFQEPRKQGLMREKNKQLILAHFKIMLEFTTFFNV